LYSSGAEPVPSGQSKRGTVLLPLIKAWKTVPRLFLFYFSSVCPAFLVIVSAAVVSFIPAAVSGRISGAVSAAVLRRVLRLILASVLRIVSVL